MAADTQAFERRAARSAARHGPWALAPLHARAHGTAQLSRHRGRAAAARAAGAAHGRPELRHGNLQWPFWPRRPARRAQRLIALRDRAAVGGLGAGAVRLRLAAPSPRRGKRARRASRPRRWSGFRAAEPGQRARLRAGNRRAPGHLLAVELGAGARYRRASLLQGLLARAHRAAPLSVRQHRDAPDGVPRLVTPHGAHLCRAVHRRAAGGRRSLHAARSARSSTARSCPMAGISRATPRRWSSSCSTSCRFANASSRATACRPSSCSDAIDRIMPMLRFFRIGDGTLASFNGCGPTPTDALATVLAYDDVEGAPLSSAVNSGYVRHRAAGRCSSSADIGAGAGPSLSTNAHAGCLSFEMASGDAPMIVNCGAPSPRSPGLAAVRPLDRRTFDADLRGALLGEFVSGVDGRPSVIGAPLVGPHQGARPRSPTRAREFADQGLA